MAAHVLHQHSGARRRSTLVWRNRAVATALLCAGGVAVLAGCGDRVAPRPSSAAFGPHSETLAYCAQIRSAHPTAGMTFELEASILRSAAPLAPSALHDDFATVLLAYEQVQDREDGTISADQETLVGTERLASALNAIAGYTAQTCETNLGVTLPTPPGG